MPAFPSTIRGDALLDVGLAVGRHLGTNALTFYGSGGAMTLEIVHGQPENSEAARQLADLLEQALDEGAGIGVGVRQRAQRR